MTSFVKRDAFSGGSAVKSPAFLAKDAHKLVGVRGVLQVVHSEHDGLGEPPVLILELLGVPKVLLDDLLVAVRSGDLPLDLSRVEVALVLENIERASPRLRVD